MSADLITRIPPRGTQAYYILAHLQSGRGLTVATALREMNVYALSQRIGDLKRRYGWPIQSRTITTEGGAHVSEYYLPKVREQADDRGRHPLREQEGSDQIRAARLA